MSAPVSTSSTLDPHRIQVQATDRLLRVEILTADGTPCGITPEGHVPLAAGTVYQIALTNRASRRGVAHVSLDGASVTEGGLVLEPYQRVVLQRCVATHETGRFTVRPEGDTAAFGASGGRDNPDLGLIHVRLDVERPRPRPVIPTWPVPQPPVWPVPTPAPWLQGPIWIGGSNDAVFGALQDSAAPRNYRSMNVSSRMMKTAAPTAESSPTLNAAISASHLAEAAPAADAYTAAGTALTGHSDQRFHSVTMGPCDEGVGELCLRLVVGPPLRASVRPLPRVAVPARPRSAQS